MVIDAKALYDTYHKETTVLGTACKRTAIELLVLKQTLWETDSVMRWVSSERQVADGLTKIAARQLFSDRLRTQQYRLVFDESFTAAKKKTAEDRHKSENEGTKRKRKTVQPDPAETIFLLSSLAQTLSQARPPPQNFAASMPKGADFTADWSDDEEQREDQENEIASEDRRYERERRDEDERQDQDDEDEDRRDDDEDKHEDEQEPQGKGKGKTRTRAGRRGGRSVREWRERHQQQQQQQRPQQRWQQNRQWENLPPGSVQRIGD